MEIFLPRSGTVLGYADLRFAYMLQPFEMVIDRQFSRSVFQEGVALRLIEGSEPLWIFYEPEQAAPSTLFVPHLLQSIARQGAVNDLLERMMSFDSIQEFSWMGGCVLDGLQELAHLGIVTGNERLTQRAQQTIQLQLGMFFDSEGVLRYENPSSEPADGKISGIECPLPFAVLARTWPQHPALQVAKRYLLAKQNDSGIIQDGQMLSAEGSYTVAYPLAVMAEIESDGQLAAVAIRQLLERMRKLNAGDTLYLRSIAHPDRTEHTFPHWARAYAWYMLGLARSLPILQRLQLSLRLDESNLRQLVEEFRRIADVAMRQQRGDGLWSCFTNEPSVREDTSGSAGIAAALALGVQHGLLPGEALQRATKTLEALESFLTPDGLLTGVAQSNRGGIGLQQSDYRVISQMGMGLMTQLYAVLHSLSRKPPPHNSDSL